MIIPAALKMKHVASQIPIHQCMALQSLGRSALLIILFVKIKRKCHANHRLA